MAGLFSKIGNLFGGDTGQGAIGGAASGAVAGAPFGPYGAAAGGLLGGLAGGFGGHAKGKEGKKQKKALKKHAKQEAKNLKSNVAAQKAYNKQYYGGPHGEKAYNKELAKFQKKYGGEKFQKWDALNPQQKGVFEQLISQGKKGLKNLRTPEDFKKVQKEGLGKAGGGALEKLLNQPSITDLRQYGPFQQGQESIQDLLSNNPEAFNKFAAPEMRRFNEQTIPGLIGRFGAGGQNNSALNSALANSGADLNERLGALRAGLQSEGRQQALQYGQGIQQGENAQAGIFGKAAQTAPSYLDLYLKQQGLQANNIQNQNNQAANFAQLGLGVNPYHVKYTAPQFKGGILTGGPKPVNYSPQQAPQFAPQQPTAAEQFGSSFFQPALQAAGKGIGQQFASGNLGNFFGGGSPSPTGAPASPNLWNMNQLGGT